MADPAALIHDGGRAPDLMNDAQYDTNTLSGGDGLGEPDTCRICRGEGSDAEPLFHPCKCSGSIKFVHQDCLMEWLSHSQKKHCELCKTAFRFTKLYSPTMPQSLPFRVLIWHLAVRSVKNITTWLRFCLVVTVWLGALPYIIRQVWRLLFWLSDGGWPPAYLETAENITTTQAYEVARELQLATLMGNGTSPATPFRAMETTSASMGAMMDRLLGYLMPISQSLNVSSADPLTTSLFKSLYNGLGLQSISDSDRGSGNISVSKYVMDLSPATRSPSLLSEVSFLRNLTRSSHVNQVIITIAEGYIITILVVVCFILVFLIREWVVQQQPGINMGAGFNAEFAAAQRPREDAQPHEQGAQNLNEQRNPGQRPMARIRRRNNIVNGADEDAPANDFQDIRQNIDLQFNESDQSRTGRIRNAQEPASEIQRGITDEPRMAEEFLNIWRRADGNPEEVLKIIEREDKNDQLRYWVNAMKILQKPESSNTRNRGPSQIRNTTLEAQSLNPSKESPHDDNSEKSTSSSESWQEVRALPIPEHEALENPAQSRGSSEELRSSVEKGKAVAPRPQDTDESDSENDISLLRQKALATPAHLNNHISFPATSAASSSSRPRAFSDGPPLGRGLAPLASNNWTFSNLPGDENEDVNPNLFPSSTKQTEDEADAPAPVTVSRAQGMLPQESDEVGQAWGGNGEFGLQEDIEGFNESDLPVAQPRLPRTVALDDGLPPRYSIQNNADGSVRVRTRGPDGRETDDWDRVFGTNRLQEDTTRAEVTTEPEAEPSGLDALQPAELETIAVRPPEPQGFLKNIADFLWGGIGDDHEQEEQDLNDEHIVQDLNAEAPFVPVLPINGIGQRDLAEQDHQAAQALNDDGLDLNDPDAIEDAEDFEGIMELVGMRGPIFSLLQNALFSAFLLALTVAFGVWIPYNLGRVVLLLIANPGPAFKLPLRLIFGIAALMQDIGLSLLGIVSYCVLPVLLAPIKIWSQIVSTNRTDSISSAGARISTAAWQLSSSAFNRIMDGSINSIVHFADSEIFAFSAASHEALVMIQDLIIDSLTGLGALVIFLFVGDYSISSANTLALLMNPIHLAWDLVSALPAWLAQPDSWVISLELGTRASPLDLQLSVWGGMDRFWAVVVGYAALTCIGALYVRNGSPFSAGNAGREWEATIIELLNQAGGVMKVILIISIEMLVFPLYCGLLLDAALLPLFEDTTLMSRLLFTINSPLTSTFIHWFVGTCYMFHFALFVSMCRKIMRKGVLYFIRDPDDPTFHPVRDVLERNVATQLRKILFSALVYGGLVVVCLGGVVWGLAYAFKGVLPIHWSSNEPVLEFPIDLLFYNFLMPLAVKFFRPSDGLHAMYSWWFRQCAKMLRLTWFMFDERRKHEEGYSVRRSWIDVFRGAKGDTTKPYDIKDLEAVWETQPEARACFIRDGRYVRAPASDQVRIPKESQIFLEVNELNERLDGEPDRVDGIHGSQSDQCKLVYVPPWFRCRIFLFITSIWLFAAVTGVSITIIPLVLGRMIFAKIIPPHIRKNDVYAFSIGIYILGSCLYAVLHVKQFCKYLLAAAAVDANTPQKVIRRITSASVRVASVAWTYAAFLLILPTLYTLVIELYFIVPLHTYFGGGEQHVVHFVQSWTLGLLYVKLTTRLILWHDQSRPAQALRSITRNGYLRPDARLATRSFILPAVLLLSTAIVGPWVMGRLMVLLVLKNSPETHILAYRYAYPMSLCAGLIGVASWILSRWVKGWRMKIRDEVYLIGERLHNFGERKVASGGGGAIMMRSSVVR